MRGKPFTKGHTINLGRKHSDEIRARMSAAFIGRVSNNKGKKMSEAQKKKISTANKGRVVPQKKLKAMSDVMLGRFSDSKHWNWKGGVSKDKKYRKAMYELWVSANRDKTREYQRMRRVRKMGARGNHTIAEWEDLKAMHNNQCVCCFKQEPHIKLAEDHIIPLTKGGSDDISNIQPLCKSCNSKKHTKEISYV